MTEITHTFKKYLNATAWRPRLLDTFSQSLVLNSLPKPDSRSILWLLVFVLAVAACSIMYLAPDLVVAGVR